MSNKNTLFVGKVFLDLPRVGSTNQYALDLLSKSKPKEGTVIYTSNQVAGRGQIGSTWISQAGKNVAMSVIFYPSFLNIAQQFILTKAFSLALRDALAEHLPNAPQIKWPNDIYVGDRKVTGILLQNSISGSVIQSCVAGIGVNVNQVDFPIHLPNPTSLKLETGTNFDLYALINQICRHLELRYLQLKDGRLSSLHEDYLKHLYGWRKTRRFQTPDGSLFEGKISGVDTPGRLLIEKANGKIQAFDLKAVQFK